MKPVKRSWPNGYLDFLAADGFAPEPVDELATAGLLLTLVLLAFVSLCCPSIMAIPPLSAAVLGAPLAFAALSAATVASRTCRVLFWRGILVLFLWPIMLLDATYNVVVALLTLFVRPPTTEIDPELPNHENANDDNHMVVKVDNAENAVDPVTVIKPFQGDAHVQTVEISWSKLSQLTMKWKCFTNMMGKHDFDQDIWKASWDKMPNLTEIMLKNVHINGSKVKLSMFPKTVKKLYLENCMIFEQCQEEINTSLWNRSQRYKNFACHRLRPELILPMIQPSGEVLPLQEIFLKDCYDQNLDPFIYLVTDFVSSGWEMVENVDETWGLFRKGKAEIVMTVKEDKTFEQVDVLKIERVLVNRVLLSFIDSSDSEALFSN